jgi:hypothetical protein
LTGQSLEAPWWELLRQQLCTEKGVIDHDPLPLPSPLQLVVNHDTVNYFCPILKGAAFFKEAASVATSGESL